MIVPGGDAAGPPSAGTNSTLMFSWENNKTMPAATTAATIKATM